MGQRLLGTRVLGLNEDMIGMIRMMIIDMIMEHTQKVVKKYKYMKIKRLYELNVDDEFESK